MSPPSGTRRTIARSIGSTLPGQLSGAPEASADRPSRLRARTPQAANSPQPDGSTFRSTSRDLPRLPSGMVQVWPVHCHATGRGYARVWLGNVLLLLITLGLAWPWTQRRVDRYFLSRTEVAGYPLDFHLPGHLLWPRLGITAALCLGVAGAALGSVTAGLLALSLSALVWPLLLFVQMNHRIGGVTWAGHRVAFEGQWLRFYPVAGLPLLVAGGVVWWAWSVGARAQATAQAMPYLLAVLGLWLLYLPAGLWAYFQFRQVHIRLGPLRMLWQTRLRDVGWALGRAGGWAGLWALLVLGAACAGLALWQWWRPGLPDTAVIAVLGAAAAAGLALGWPSVEASLFAVVWNRTGNRHLRFRSSLTMQAYARRYVRLSLRLLMTLGLYWPWAVVSLRRMRWQSMVVMSRVDPAVLRQRWGKERPPPTGVHLAPQPAAQPMAPPSPARAAPAPRRAA